MQRFLTRFNQYEKHVTGITKTQTGVHWSALTLKMLVVTIDAQWEGMGDVGSVRYEPALLPHALP